jgi:predicted O-methyltransferase YrrM
MNLSAKFFQAGRYLTYLLKAKRGGHGVHSPYVYNLVKEVLEDDRSYYIFEDVEQLRRQLLKSRERVQVLDLGAGTQSGSGAERKVSEIARYAAQLPGHAQLLFRLVQFIKPKVMIELGTSLGVSTAYMAAANLDGKVYSIEGAPSIAALAQRHLKHLGIQNADIRTGSFETELPALLKELGRADWVYLDGNHRKAPTLQYFEWLLPYMQEQSVLVFDDIHWSPEMEEAWLEICSHPRVTCTVDLFKFGLVYFNPDFKEKQHFILKY